MEAIVVIKNFSNRMNPTDNSSRPSSSEVQRIIQKHPGVSMTLGRLGISVVFKPQDYEKINQIFQEEGYKLSVTSS